MPALSEYHHGLQEYVKNWYSVYIVKRAIDELVKKGYVVKEKRRRKNGGKTSNMYRCKYMV